MSQCPGRPGDHPQDRAPCPRLAGCFHLYEVKKQSSVPGPGMAPPTSEHPVFMLSAQTHTRASLSLLHAASRSH